MNLFFYKKSSYYHTVQRTYSVQRTAAAASLELLLGGWQQTPGGTWHREAQPMCSGQTGPGICFLLLFRDVALLCDGPARGLKARRQLAR